MLWFPPYTCEDGGPHGRPHFEYFVAGRERIGQDSAYEQEGKVQFVIDPGWGSQAPFPAPTQSLFVFFPSSSWRFSL